MFRRRRQQDTTEQPAGPDTEATPAEQAPETEEPAGAPGAVAPEPRADGPWDESEVDDPAEGGRIDLGALWLPGVEGMQLRVEMDEATRQIAAVSVVLGQAAVQVAPFAAPRTEGIWDEVRAEMAAGVTSGGGAVEEVEGPFGRELSARLPVRLPDGRPAAQPVRFAGVDGPRWFLRAAFSGQAALDPAAAEPLERLVRGIVVVRGSGPMAPREPLPLRLPPGATPVAAGAGDGTGDTAAAGDGTGDTPTAGEPAAGPREQDPMRPFERGPEITETR